MQPAAKSFLRDSGREGFIEIGFPRHEEALMGQFVEQQFGEISFRVVNERVEDWVTEPAERRVRGHSGDVDIEAILGQTIPILSGRGFGEISAVVQAANRRVPP